MISDDKEGCGEGGYSVGEGKGGGEVGRGGGGGDGVLLQYDVL